MKWGPFEDLYDKCHKAIIPNYGEGPSNYNAAKAYYAVISLFDHNRLFNGDIIRTINDRIIAYPMINLDVFTRVINIYEFFPEYSGLH